MKNLKTKVVPSRKIQRNSFFLAERLFVNKLLIVFLCILSYSNTYSQENYSKLAGTDNNCPIIIINDKIISNESFIENKTQFITQMAVMKEKPNRKDHTFYNLSENGIVLVKINKKIKTKSQQELNRFFGIHKKNKIFINGYLIEDCDYKISTESIVEIELVIPDSINKLKNKAINIWTLTKTERTNNCQN